jgi:hypothetical protein
MARKLTITLDEDVYAALKAKVGPRRISRFLNNLARPLVSEGADELVKTSGIDTVQELLAEVDSEGC